MLLGKKTAFAAVSLLLAGISQATLQAEGQSLETRGDHCNDTYFNSDGGGITGCINFALRLDDDVLGIGISGVEPEQFGSAKKTDPLQSLSRIDAWYGRNFDTPMFDSFVAARAGIEGGIADDIGRALQESVHQLVGENNHRIPSTHDTTFLAGVSGWGRKNYRLSESQNWKSAVAPYGHGALGNDTIEAGAGLMLSLQPASEPEPLALLLPKTGSYAPAFGGDGIGVFAGVRAVALETLYGDDNTALIAEAGVMAQATFFDFAVVGVSASCTNKPYDGAPTADCKSTFQLGGLF